MTSRRREMSNGAFAALLILPSFIIITAVIIYPLLNAAVTSFFRYYITDSAGMTFVGLKNYARMFGSAQFWTALVNTVVYVGGTVIGELLIAFAIALLVNVRFRLKNLVNSLFFVPWIIPSVVVSLITKYLFFDHHYGVVNAVLLQAGLVTDMIPWLKDPALAMPTVIAATIWKMFPFMFVILYAGLQAIPEEEVEASRIDGASAFQRFRHITLPNMQEIIVLATTLEFIWQFQYMTVIWTTTQGGPIDRTTTLPVLIYRTAFKGGMDMGTSSTIGVFWLVFLMAFAMLYVRTAGRRES
jgi:multiple sugar transport system permease protein